MVKEQKHNEKWLLSKGWKKYSGFKLEHDMIEDCCDGKNPCYFPSIADVEGITKCKFYTPKDDDEYATDDLDEAIERQEEIDEDKEVSSVSSKH